MRHPDADKAFLHDILHVTDRGIRAPEMCVQERAVRQHVLDKPTIAIRTGRVRGVWEQGAHGGGGPPTQTRRRAASAAASALGAGRGAAAGSGSDSKTPKATMAPSPPRKFRPERDVRSFDFKRWDGSGCRRGITGGVLQGMTRQRPISSMEMHRAAAPSAAACAAGCSRLNPSAGPRNPRREKPPRRSRRSGAPRLRHRSVRTDFPPAERLGPLTPGNENDCAFIGPASLNQSRHAV